MRNDFQNQPEPEVKAIGELTKYDIIEVPYVEVDGFFKQATEENWPIEDIIDEWHQREEYKSIVLFPLKKHQSLFALIKDKLKCVYDFSNDEYTGEFIFLAKKDKLPLTALKNTEELSGEGPVLIEFNLRFQDFSKHYTRTNSAEDKEFFTLSPNELILNTIRLVVDKERTLGMKLTGKAAEIASRKAKEAQNANS